MLASQTHPDATDLVQWGPQTQLRGHRLGGRGKVGCHRGRGDATSTLTKASGALAQQ